MRSPWARLSPSQKRNWAVIAGVIVTGSVFKVAYFFHAREILVADARRSHKDGLERLQEAHEFAAWSKQDRESRIPKLTNEQQEQLRQYLRLVEEHGFKKAIENQGNSKCIGCPVVGHVQKSLETNARTSSS